MPKQNLTIEELRDRINSGEASDPIIFLEALVNGQDPRKFSGVYDLILEIDSFTNGSPTKEDWEELINYATSHSKYGSVSIGESHSAAKTLAEYLHPKRKQVEIKSKVEQSGNLKDNPLTVEDIDLFKEKFNDNF